MRTTLTEGRVATDKQGKECHDLDGPRDLDRCFFWGLQVSPQGA